MSGIDKPKTKETDASRRQPASDALHRSFKPGGDHQTPHEAEKAKVGSRAEGKLHESFKPGERGDKSVTQTERLHPGDGKIPDKETLSKAGEEPHRNGLTRAGHAFQKHGDRSSGIWEKPKGNPEQLNKTGQRTLDGFINAPDAQWTARHHKRFGNIVESRQPDGRGARWSADGKHLHGFLDPNKSP